MSLLRSPPETRFADTGDGFVAYQTFGWGRDLDERGSHELKGSLGSGGSTLSAVCHEPSA